MKDYVLGVDASEDLEEIWEYFAADKIAADRRIGKLFDAFEALARTPGIGHRRSDLTDYPSVVLALRGLPHYLSRRKSANPDRRHYAGLSRHPDLSAPTFEVIPGSRIKSEPIPLFAPRS